MSKRGMKDDRDPARVARDRAGSLLIKSLELSYGTPQHVANAVIDSIIDAVIVKLEQSGMFGAGAGGAQLRSQCTGDPFALQGSRSGKLK